MKKTILFILGIITLFTITLSTPAYAGADKAIADGSFVQTWLCGSWSDARWQQEFTAMKNAGMHYLIIGPIVQCETGQVTQTVYPSALPNTAMFSYLNGHDMMDNCLRNAEAAGIKVFIGLSYNPQWAASYGQYSAWMDNQMEFDNQVCDEVWNRYKSKYPNAFYGWYWIYEIENVSFTTQVLQDQLIHAMNIQLDHLTAANEHLPFMWCPFMVSKLGTSQDYQAMWEYVFANLHTVQGDIFAPQDCVGAGGLKIDQVDEWFSALRKAVDTKPGLAFWSDVETFVESDWSSATIDRFVRQLKIEQPYVENYITFAYCHYDSPYNVDPGFQTTYLDYLKNGVVESTPPSVPTNLTGTINSDGVVKLNWNASTDNIGICGYKIYRNGIQICKEQVPVGVTSPALATTLTDVVLNSNTDYIYEVKAYDFANNLSESASITLNPGNIIYLANKINKGCSYTVSSASDPTYPDINNKELTNGSFARLTSKGDPAWEGYYNANEAERDITIDLGSEQPVQQFIAYFLYDSTASISLPKQVSVSISTNNVDFTYAGNLGIPQIASGTSASSGKCICTLSNAASVRYVKFSVTPGSVWTFDDEYEIRNNNSAGVNDVQEVPKEYSLKQNYPNPFNPSTIINYEIIKRGNVSLKVFDVLGKEITTLVNEEKPAGSYSINFNASSIPSGVYFYQIKTGSYFATKKMLLLK
ncbi:MAG: DUF4434 domain-containing protein [Ignavibacteriaceae bacterium]|nr:DUF4434 domain-containing protein [Ignavibacteriaceae bacterium]